MSTKKKKRRKREKKITDRNTGRKTKIFAKKEREIESERTTDRKKRTLKKALKI